MAEGKNEILKVVLLYLHVWWHMPIWTYIWIKVETYTSNNMHSHTHPCTHTQICEFKNGIFKNYLCFLIKLSLKKLYAIKYFLVKKKIFQLSCRMLAKHSLYKALHWIPSLRSKEKKEGRKERRKSVREQM